jgi:predicted lactoylglutathione lyase
MHDVFGHDWRDALTSIIVSSPSARSATPRRESLALLALSADSRDAVNATLAQAAAAGGRADPNPAQDHGFMFGRSVEDPDGNVWEIMWMDPGR